VIQVMHYSALQTRWLLHMYMLLKLYELQDIIRRWTMLQQFT